jgi:hypothetical protein
VTNLGPGTWDPPPTRTHTHTHVSETAHGTKCSQASDRPQQHATRLLKQSRSPSAQSPGCHTHMLPCAKHALGENALHSSTHRRSRLDRCGAAPSRARRRTERSRPGGGVNRLPPPPPPPPGAMLRCLGCARAPPRHSSANTTGRGNPARGWGRCRRGGKGHGGH